MRKSPVAHPGLVHRLEHTSLVLRGNTPGDPTTRPLLVYTPPGYDERQHYPLLVDLVGYAGSGGSHTNWRAFGYNLPERLDRLIGDGRMPPVVVAMPDGFTAYGGNQYIDSAGTGAYATWLVDEIVPFVESRFSAGGSRARRGVFGKSSGGYGALVHGMKHADTWGAFASHSGDAYFEYCYQVDFPKMLGRLLKFDGSVERYLAHLWAREKIESDDVLGIMLVGMAAHYNPDPAAPLGFRMPFDTRTGEIFADRWARWLAHDPVRLVDGHVAALRSLRAIYVDCGRKDQYGLLWGARMIHDKLDAHGIVHRYEEFDDDHSDVDYRMDESLPFLAAALTD